MSDGATPSDRQVRRTRAALATALTALIVEKGYDAVTVQDIIDRADVGRSTFYAHFRHKDELLQFNIENLRDWLTVAANDNTDKRPFAFSLPLLQHVEGQQELYHALTSHRGGAAVLQWFSQMATQLVRDDLRDQELPAEVILEEAATFIAGGFLALMTAWLEGTSGRTSHQVDAAFHRLTSHALQPDVP